MKYNKWAGTFHVASWARKTDSAVVVAFHVRAFLLCKGLCGWLLTINDWPRWPWCEIRLVVNKPAGTFHDVFWARTTGPAAIIVMMWAPMYSRKGFCGLVLNKQQFVQVSVSKRPNSRGRHGGGMMGKTIARGKCQNATSQISRVM